jgi:hypothetical protein
MAPNKKIKYLNMMSFIGEAMEKVPLYNKNINFDPNLGFVRYHPVVLAYVDYKKILNPTIQNRMEILCARSNFRLLCEKAYVVIAAYGILENFLSFSKSDRKLLDQMVILEGGIKYAIHMMDKIPLNIGGYNYDRAVRYVLELATVFNVLLPYGDFTQFPRHYHHVVKIQYDQLHAFGEYNPFILRSISNNDFWSHLTIMPKITDTAIPNGKNCVFYLPIVSPVNRQASLVMKMVSEGMKKANNLIQIMSFLAMLTSYEKTFMQEPGPNAVFTNYESEMEAKNANNGAWPSEFGAVAKKYFNGEDFNLYFPVLIKNVVKNIYMGAY